MKRCPISYEPIIDEADYASRGLKLLNRQLTVLQRLPLTVEQQREEAIARAGKMSIQGVQSKLSAVLKIKEGRFEIVDRGGQYIIKPPSLHFPELPENEDVTMRMAAALGIEVPVHGLLYGADGKLSYFIRRFDRHGTERLPLEDFAQLSGESRNTKYKSSMEKVAGVIDAFCTFPAIERVKLFERVLFTFLVGNEDMHLKNFSLITRDNKVELSPAYDFLNTTIALPNPKEELALPLNGKKSKLTANDLIRYFGEQRLQINRKIFGQIMKRFASAYEVWNTLLANSFLSDKMKERYAKLLAERQQRLGVLE